MTQARADLLPFYAVCDTSASMRDGGRIDALNDTIESIWDAVAVNPVVADRIRFSVLTLSGDAAVALPLCDLGTLDSLPRLVPRGLTAYGPAFDLLRSTIERDVAQLVADGYRVFRPAAFFLTDGRPTDAPGDWRAAHRRLCADDFPHRPNVVAFGLGDADPSVVAAVGTVASYAAADASSGAAAIASFGSLLVGSVVASGIFGQFRLPGAVPSGLAALDAAEELL